MHWRSKAGVGIRVGVGVAACAIALHLLQPSIADAQTQAAEKNPVLALLARLLSAPAASPAAATSPRPAMVAGGMDGMKGA